MSWFIVSLLSLLCLLLLWRLHATRQLLKNLVIAAEQAKPLLLERTGGLTSGLQIDRLVQAFNHLVAENNKITQKGREYLDQIQATLGNLREAVLIIDGENFIRLANDAFCELLERADTPTGRRLESLIQGSAFLALMRELREGGAADRREIEVQVSNRRVWLEVSAARLPDNARNPENLTLFVLHDITRQKKLEMMRTEFVANVSHELRTPVTIIKGFADTLIDEDEDIDPDNRRRFLQKIRSNSERLHHLLQDLLLLSRLEVADNVLQQERVSLATIIRDTTENFETRLDANTQRIECHYAEGNDVLLLDSLRISQVLTNLMENILRHAKGFSVIRISSQPEGEGVRCVVEDDGAGIPAKDLPLIFQRFYRVDKGRSRESGGTGLGLSIVKHIVQQHGGNLSAESEPGKFTRISFFIPYPEKLAEKAVFRAWRERMD